MIKNLAKLTIWLTVFTTLYITILPLNSPIYATYGADVNNGFAIDWLSILSKGLIGLGILTGITVAYLYFKRK